MIVFCHYLCLSVKYIFSSRQEVTHDKGIQAEEQDILVVHRIIQGVISFRDFFRRIGDLLFTSF